MIGFFRAVTRYMNVRMAIGNVVDPFGMDLQATDIDDTASAANGVISIAPLLDHVAGVYKAFFIRQPIWPVQIPECGSARADAERSVNYAQFNRLTFIANQTIRKARQAVADLKCHASSVEAKACTMAAFG